MSDTVIPVHAGLTYSVHCPVCKASSDNADEKPEAFDRTSGQAYLRPYADSAGLSLADLYESIKAFECRACGAVFFNPWFDQSARNRIFIEGHPVHNVGWRSLQERFEQRLNPNLQIAPDLLMEAVRARVGKVSSYAELGCPFQGLLLHMADDDLIGSVGRDRSRFTSMRAQDYQRFLPPLRLFMRLGGLANAGARQLSIVRRKRNRLRGRWYEDSFPEETREVLRTFVPLQSSKFWGLNCSLFGDSCTALANRALGATVVPYPQFADSPTTYDLIGIFNVLDHQDDPLSLLRQCLKKGRAVVCLGHEAPISPQHHYGLGRSFFESLKETIDSCLVEELSQEDSGTVLYLLTSSSK